MLADVLDALALVGLGRVVRADARGGLADHLLVAALDRHLQPVVLDRDREAVRDREDLGRREAERKRQLLALQDRLEAGALDRELLLEALRDADRHVVDQRAGEAVEGAERLVVGAGDDDRAVLHLRGDALVHRVRELAELALDRHRLARDRGGDAIGELDGFFTDSRHVLDSSIRRPCRLPRRRASPSSPRRRT